MANNYKNFRSYTGPAGGWGALKSTAIHWIKSEQPVRNINTLLKTNQPHGFDCPGCAWGEKHDPAKIKFCENGAKAVNWEATAKAVTADFFEQHSVAWLKKQSHYYLEFQGRLTQPMRYNRETDHYAPISWDDAVALIAKHLQALDSPNQAAFYTSGRTSNEAAFLYQLFGRVYGTNNFPDCSNMCHEASGYALTSSIGIGKGTVTLDDFEQADAVFVFGQNPGTNHPRMLETLRSVVARGGKLISFNTLKERGLERFQNPQHPLEMLTNDSKATHTSYYCPNIGGDMALVRGIVKALIALEAAAQAKGEAVFDHDFIAEHTQGMASYLAKVENTHWPHIESQSGLSRPEIETIAQVYANAQSVICTWAMGITQHKHSVATIHEIVNLLALRGNIGKPGAGACPVRGHSNVQGDRTMGINEKPSEAFLDGLAAEFGFTPPQDHGLAVVDTIKGMQQGKIKAFIAMGGNFAAATPDSHATEAALAQCDLTVHISTKLNRSHLVTGKDALILPCLGRTDIDRQPSGLQKVTVEDSFSMVHASAGVVEPLSHEQWSEPAIIAAIAHATFANTTSTHAEPSMPHWQTHWDSTAIDWLSLSESYDLIREKISAVIPGFGDFNHKIQADGGFYLGNSARERHWKTPSQKALIHSHSLPESILSDRVKRLTSQSTLVLQTLRSHDQYNTTIYGMNDRYRGIKNDRKVLFINPADIERMRFSAGDSVTIHSLWDDDVERKVEGFKLVPYSIPAGNLAAYYPETNPLVPLDSIGDYSQTPTSKSIAVELTPFKETAAIAMTTESS